MNTEKAIKKLNTDFRRDKSGAFHLVEPLSKGKQLYYESRSDYKTVLMNLLIKTVERLQALGVPASVNIEEDRKAVA